MTVAAVFDTQPVSFVFGVCTKKKQQSGGYPSACLRCTEVTEVEVGCRERRRREGAQVRVCVWVLAEKGRTLARALTHTHASQRAYRSHIASGSGRHAGCVVPGTVPSPAAVVASDEAFRFSIDLGYYALRALSQTKPQSERCGLSRERARMFFIASVSLRRETRGVRPGAALPFSFAKPGTAADDQEGGPWLFTSPGVPSSTVCSAP